MSTGLNLASCSREELVAEANNQLKIANVKEHVKDKYGIRPEDLTPELEEHFLRAELMTEKLIKFKKSQGQPSHYEFIEQKSKEMKVTQGQDFMNRLKAEVMKMESGCQICLSESLTKEDWVALQSAVEKTEREFDLRKNLLMTRLNASVKSFLWSDQAKKHQNEITEMLNQQIAEPRTREKRKSVEDYFANILTTTPDELYVKKISSAPPETRLKGENALTKVKVGKVPDRGGRSLEHQAPPPEMPSWSQRKDPGPQGHRGGGHHRGGNRGGGGGGNRYQGGGGGNRYQGGGGGYHGGGGGGGGRYQGGGGGGGRHRDGDYKGNRVQGRRY